MRRNVTHELPHTALERLLESLESELLAASDEDILEAARGLGMRPEMKGSAAFLGLRYATRPRPEDFAAMAAWKEGIARFGASRPATASPQPAPRGRRERPRSPKRDEE